MNSRPSASETPWLNSPGILLVALAVYFLLGLGSAFTRAPWGDEAFCASPVYTFLHHGYFGLTFDSANGFDKYLYSQPPLPFLFQWLWAQVFGFHVVAIRLLNSIWGLIWIGSVFFLFRELFTQRVALWTAAFLAADYTFVMNTVTGRVDAMSGGLAFASLAAYVVLRLRTSLTVTILVSNALLAGGALAHPVGPLLCGLILLGLMFTLDRDRLRWWQWLLVPVPHVIGVLLWSIYILQAPQYFWSQFGGVSLGMGRLNASRTPHLTLWREWTVRWLGYFGVRPNASPTVLLKLALPAGYMLGLAVCLGVRSLREKRMVRIMLWLTGLTFLVLGLVDGTKQYMYLIYYLPWLNGLLAAAFLYFMTGSTVRWRLAMVAAAMLLSVQILPQLYRMRMNTFGRQYDQAAAAIRSRLKPDSFAIGSSEFCFALAFDANRFITEPDLGFSKNRIPDIVVTESSFQDNIDAAGRKNPAVAQYISRILGQELHLVHENESYRVWARR